MNPASLFAPLQGRGYLPTSRRQRYAVGVACALFAMAIHWVLYPIVGGRSPFLFFVPMLILAASVAGKGPGFVVVLTAIASATLVMSPVGSLLVDSWRDQLTLVLFAVLGCVLVFFGSRYRLIERKAAEAERRLALAQSAVGVGLFELDWATQRILCSSALWDLLGVPPTTAWVAAEEWRKPIHADDLQGFLDVMQSAIAQGRSDYEFEYRINHLASGSVRWILCRVHIEREATSKVVSLRGAVGDVTHRRQLEAAVLEADNRKDEFLATLAHELRNPLAPIRQAAQIIKAPSATEAQKRWCQDVIERQVKHMSHLLDDLLDVSRITRGVFELHKSALDLKSTIEAAVETVRGLIDHKQHVLTVTLPAEPVWVNADGLRLCQVVANLLTNAAKFTEARGRLQLSAVCENGQLTLRISDSGVGIAKEDLPRIFEMFIRGHIHRTPSEAGLGIGLTLTRGIVELHGGSIEALSDGPGCGSEFIVRLPLGEATHVIPDEAVGVHVASVSRRILVVDDNRDAADSLTAVLRVYGHEVITAYDGEEGLAAYTSFQPEVAVLDIGMPKLSGHELARRIRQMPSDRSVTLIAATGWGQEGDRRKSASAGFDHHLTKPIDLEHLSHILSAKLH